MTERKKERKERNEVMEKNNKTASLHLKYTSDVCCFHVSGSGLVECKQASKQDQHLRFCPSPLCHMCILSLPFTFLVHPLHLIYFHALFLRQP
jgi:hypothetical protein